jgi:sigma-E factor negative regulatory protein RseC
VVKQAVLLSFIMPLFLLIGSLMLAKGSHLSDESAALIAIGLLVFYYLVLWALKGNISKSISFRIEPE